MGISVIAMIASGVHNPHATWYDMAFLMTSSISLSKYTCYILQHPRVRAIKLSAITEIYRGGRFYDTVIARLLS